MLVLSDGVYNYFFKKFWIFSFLIRKEAIINKKQLDVRFELLEKNAHYLKTSQDHVVMLLSEMLTKMGQLVDASTKPMPINVTVSQPETTPTEQVNTGGVTIYRSPAKSYY